MNVTINVHASDVLVNVAILVGLVATVRAHEALLLSVALILYVMHQVPLVLEHARAIWIQALELVATDIQFPAMIET